MTSPVPDVQFALLVDPDAETGDAVREALQETGLDLQETKTLSDAMRQATNDVAPRLVLAELSLPDGSGFALCRTLRESPALAEVPIMLLSRWTQEADRILAFECGADDFLAKPFFRRELSSRIKAVLRRSGAPIARAEAARNRERGLLDIDEEARELRLAGSRLPVTPREFSILATLARHGGRVLSRTDLIREAWGPGERPTERSVDAHVKSLRRKLGAAKNSIETVRGLGYRFAEKVARASD